MLQLIRDPFALAVSGYLFHQRRYWWRDRKTVGKTVLPTMGNSVGAGADGEEDHEGMINNDGVLPLSGATGDTRRQRQWIHHQQRHLRTKTAPQYRCASRRRGSTKRKKKDTTPPSSSSSAASRSSEDYDCRYNGNYTLMEESETFSSYLQRIPEEEGLLVEMRMLEEIETASLKQMERHISKCSFPP